MDGTEERVGAPSAGTAGAATAATVPMAVGVEMVLVPPEDAPVLVVQRLVRGWLSRQQYQSLKVWLFLPEMSRFFAPVSLSELFRALRKEPPVKEHLRRKLND